MAVFFELTTDLFKERFDVAADGPRAGRAGAASVRRPLRGLEVKEDTFAMLKVIDIMGRPIRLYDSSSVYGTSPQTTNFILQKVTEPRTEKMQVVETFGEPYIFFYGEQARFIECDAILLNSQDFNWQAEFWANYDEHLRGSKCAESGARVYLFYDDKVVEGYMVQAGAIQDAQNPMAVNMQFKLFITNYRNISLIGDPRFPIRLGVDVSFAEGTKEQWVQTPDGQIRVVLRGLIHDNWDEWTGPQPVDVPPPDPQEVNDLIAAAVAAAAANAANMDRVDSIVDGALDKAQWGGGGSGSPNPSPTPGTSPMEEFGCSEPPYQTGSQCYCETQKHGGPETIDVPCDRDWAPAPPDAYGTSPGWSPEEAAARDQQAKDAAAQAKAIQAAQDAASAARHVADNPGQSGANSTGVFGN